MKAWNRKLTVISAALTLASLSVSEAKAAETSTASTKAGSRGLWFLLGTDVGGAQLSAGSANESKKNGMQLDFKGLLSYSSLHWAVDGGLGWLYNKMQSENNVGYEVKTRSGFAELSPRYRLGPSLQLGLINQILFGTDSTFSESIGKNSNAIFSGVQALYDFSPASDDKFRASIQVMTDLNISQRQLMVAQVGLQIGFSVLRDRTRLESDLASADSLSSSSAAPRADVQLSLDSEVIHFDTDRAALWKDSKKLLSSIAKFLGSNPQAWGSLRIEGHADERGTFEYNLDLSNERADSVKSVLISSGVPSSKILTHGFSKSRPLDSRSLEEAWAKNRRVEMYFYGVYDPELLKKGLAQIKEKHIERSISGKF